MDGREGHNTGSIAFLFKEWIYRLQIIHNLQEQTFPHVKPTKGKTKNVTTTHYMLAPKAKLLYCHLNNTFTKK
jgi:hypothetical protein